jgi:diphosphomevalonate decarboxylase
MSSGSIIQNHSSLSLIEKLYEYRKRNSGIYFTSDTGPSLVFMSSDRSMLKEFSEYSGTELVEGSIITEWDRTPCADRFSRASQYFES